MTNFQIIYMKFCDTKFFDYFFLQKPWKMCEKRLNLTFYLQKLGINSWKFQ